MTGMILNFVPFREKDTVNSRRKKLSEYRYPLESNQSSSEKTPAT